MKRVFLRTWFVALALFFILLGAAEFLWIEFPTHEETAYYQQFRLGGYRYALEALEQRDNSPDALAELEERYGVGAILIPVEELPEHVANQFVHSFSAWEETDAGEFEFVKTHVDGVALRLGPFNSYPSLPNTRKIAVIAIVALIYGVAFWWTLRPLHRSQRAVVDAATRLGGGDLSARIQSKDMTAAPAMATAFNDMARRIDMLVRNQTEILQVASHELRTPIARLRMGIFGLVGDQAEQDGRLDELENDLVELDDLVDEVLTHARLGWDPEARPTDSLRLASLVDTVLEDFRPMAEQIELRMETRIWELPPVVGVPHLLQRALRNVVANAMRYSRSVIIVDAWVEDEQVFLTVDDDGPGIAVEHRERALLPFTRLDENSHHGMGLAIVQRVLTWHGGTTRIEQSASGGCRVLLRWPVDVPEPGPASKPT